MDISNWLTTENIVFVMGIFGIVFSIYNYFKNPQIKAQITDTAMEKDIKNINEKITEIKEVGKTHETQIALVIQGLTRLETIINERVPKK